MSTRAASEDPVVDAVHGGLVHRVRHQLPLLVWLVLVWILLWGTWSWANLISGILVALVVTTLLPLPPVVGGTPVRQAALASFVGFLLSDLVVSAAQVAWLTMSPGVVRRARSSRCGCAPTPTCC